MSTISPFGFAEVCELPHGLSAVLLTDVQSAFVRDGMLTLADVVNGRGFPITGTASSLFDGGTE